MHELIWSIRESLMHRCACQPAVTTCAGDGTTAATYYAHTRLPTDALSASCVAVVLRTITVVSAPADAYVAGAPALV